MVGLGWSFRGPTSIEEDGNSWFEIRITELPGFFVAAATKEDARAAVGAALEAYLASFVDAGEDLPLAAAALAGRAAPVRVLARA
jgi:predicted RNase H-like HicB family nuclease